MSLDFAVLEDDGAPAAYLPLSIQLHHELMAGACELNLVQLLRFKEYYQDLEVAPDELAAVSRDVDTLLAATDNAAPLAFLNQLNRLISMAAADRKSLQAIAD